MDADETDPNVGADDDNDGDGLSDVDEDALGLDPADGQNCAKLMLFACRKSMTLALTRMGLSSRWNGLRLNAVRNAMQPS